MFRKIYNMLRNEIQMYLEIKNEKKLREKRRKFIGDLISKSIYYKD